jgi:hypothetical protein
MYNRKKNIREGTRRKKRAFIKTTSNVGRSGKSFGGVFETPCDELLPSHIAEHRRRGRLVARRLRNEHAIHAQLLIQQLKKATVRKQRCMLQFTTPVTGVAGRSVRSDEAKAQDLDGEVTCVHWIKMLVLSWKG